MKAIQVFGPKKVELVEIDEPICQSDEIKIKIDAVGICGTDIEIINGDMAYYSSGMAKYPIILGHEWCGTVIELGVQACKKIKIGDPRLECYIYDICHIIGFIQWFRICKRLSSQR